VSYFDGISAAFGGQDMSLMRLNLACGMEL